MGTRIGQCQKLAHRRTSLLKASPLSGEQPGRQKTQPMQQAAGQQTHQHHRPRQRQSWAMSSGLPLSLRSAIKCFAREKSVWSPWAADIRPSAGPRRSAPPVPATPKARSGASSPAESRYHLLTESRHGRNPDQGEGRQGKAPSWLPASACRCPAADPPAGAVGGEDDGARRQEECILGQGMEDHLQKRGLDAIRRQQHQSEQHIGHLARPWNRPAAA